MEHLKLHSDCIQSLISICRTIYSTLKKYFSLINKCTNQSKIHHKSGKKMHLFLQCLRKVLRTTQCVRAFLSICPVSATSIIGKTISTSSLIMNLLRSISSMYLHGLTFLTISCQDKKFSK